MPVDTSESSASWRAEILSDAHGLAAIAIHDGRVTDANVAARQLFGAACIGTDLDELFESDGGACVRELASKKRPAVAELVLKHHGSVVHDSFLLLVVEDEWLLLAAPSGLRYTEQIGAKLTATRGELASLTRPLPHWIVELDAAIHALLEATETEEHLRRELEALGRANSAVSDAVAELPQSDLSAVLHTIALQAQALTQADYVAIGIGTDPEHSFDPWVFIGASEEVAKVIGRFPRPIGLLGSVARDGEVIRIGDVHRDARFRGFPTRHPNMGSFLGVPIVYRQRPVGNVYLANERGTRPFSEQDERLVRMLATRVGAAIETATLYAGERLHRSWLQNIIDQMPNGVVLYDENGRLRAMNQAIATLSCEQGGCVDAYGNPVIFDVRELNGQPACIEDLPMTQALRGRQMTVRKELLLRQRNGRFVPVSMSAVPVRGANGKISGVTLIVEDITERKELERLREEWAAVVAHDLRQPVGVISLAADLLLEFHAGGSSDRARRTVERIRCAAGRLNRMIADLTDASLVESKQLSIEPQRVDLEALVQSVVESVDDLTAGYDVQISVEGEHEAWIDPDRIRQVLGNLISNAAKYGLRDTVIRIEVRGRDDVLELAVTNYGPGIPPDELGRLFGRFARARGPRQGRAPGLGLGLYIARGIVEAHGGRIWAESVPGEKTTFHFTLPRTAAESSIGRPEAASNELAQR